MDTTGNVGGYFGNIGAVTTASVQDVWFKFLHYVPLLIAAIIVIILGLIIASIVGGLVKKLLQYMGVDKFVARSGLNERLSISPKYSLLSGMLGSIVKWFIIIATLMTAADLLHLPQITLFLNSILLYIPKVFVAVIILVVGILAAEVVYDLIVKGLQASKLPVQHKKTLGTVARYAIIVFAIMAALTQLDIVPQLIEILFGGLVLTLALAFGLGGREEAARWLANFRMEK